MNWTRFRLTSICPLTIATLGVTVGLDSFKAGVALAQNQSCPFPPMLISQQFPPTGAQLLNQGGPIEDKTLPSVEPPPNEMEAEYILNAAGRVAQQEAENDIIRMNQDQDLLTDDYVGNPNYFEAAGGQQFGNEGLWNNSPALQPSPLGF
uniref:Uncharacterized protein n=1 Tax=Cyanothece sp. (strain PCC 7425 / ATCC 29141) TaxID=395961 RepID=B8HVJ2_CYAP4